VIVFITYIILRKNQDDPVIPSSKIADAPLESPLIYQPSRRYEAWRFLTYMLIHHKSVGLLYNCIGFCSFMCSLTYMHSCWSSGWLADPCVSYYVLKSCVEMRKLL